MNKVEAQNLSDKNTTKSLDLRELSAKALFGYLTLLILWTAGDATGELFWTRQAPLCVLVILGIALWSFLTDKATFKVLSQKPRSEDLRKGVSWAVVTLIAASAFSGILVFALNESPWMSWSFLSSFNVFPYIYALPLLALSSFVLEFFMRGYLSKSWGKGNVAFLESITIAVALQHVLPFLLLLPMIFVWDRIAQRSGIWVAAFARALWTMGLALALSLMAS
jgi:hypothetical protein